MIAQPRAIDHLSGSALIDLQCPKIIWHRLHHTAHGKPGDILQRVSHMGKLPIDQRCQLIMIEKKIAWASITVRQNDLSVRIWHVGIQPAKSQIEQWIWLSHFFIHSPPNGDIAFDMVDNSAIAATIQINLTCIKSVQRRKIGHERSRDRLFCNRIFQMSEFCDTVGAFYEDGAQCFTIGNQPRSQHRDGRYRAVNIGFPINCMRFYAHYYGAWIMTKEIFKYGAVCGLHINRPGFPPVATGSQFRSDHLTATNLRNPSKQCLLIIRFCRRNLIAHSNNAFIFIPSPQPSLRLLA